MKSPETPTISHKAKESDRPSNKLVNEKSPYLLQHAYNPVQWYPWGDEAFEKARRENKPIFLSIGYSTCHWCHVMEHESFESQEVAEVLNEHFVSIKVDREERPDVDQVYMAFVQATTGSGGWPMSVWLTPELKPFYGGTYFPPDDSFGRPGFKSLLLRICDLWQDDQENILERSSKVIEMLTQASSTSQKGELTHKLMEGAFSYYSMSFDKEEGGFGRAPKFPRPASLFFLLRYAHTVGFDSKEGKEALEMTLFTLDKMANGGMYDHLGGGFHRYSVDNYWHVPHYEKMLYDQGQLVLTYLEAYQITKEKKYADVAHDILHYVTRDMTDKEGGFYSAEDADSLPSHDSTHKTEGAFYVWELTEIKELLDPNTAKLFIEHFGVEPDGNSPHGSDPHGELAGKNTLIRRTQINHADDQKQLDKARKILFEAREKRPHPHLDDKVITAWNGLMISAFAQASQVLKTPKYLNAAEKAASFIQKKLYDPNTQTLTRSYRQGPSKAKGYASDYAFLIQGLLDLYSASANQQWLQWALTLQEKQNTLFWDSNHGGYYSTSDKDPSILVRMKDDYDGAEPSPASVSVSNLTRFFEITGDKAHLTKAGQTAQTFAPGLEQGPTGAPQMLASINRLITPNTQIFFSGDPKAKLSQTLRLAAFEIYTPYITLLYATTDPSMISDSYQALITSEEIKDQPQAFVCRDFACQLPTNDPEALKKSLTTFKLITH